jgi:hypothetical protein
MGAFTYPIGLSNSSIDVGQSTLGNNYGLTASISPTWVLTFVGWEYRDLFRTPTNDPLTVRKPLVVENDCIQVSVSINKNVLTQSMSAVLKETDVNYETEIAPGDFVFVNMLNWEIDSRRIADNARNIMPINGINDGFKGFFKIQGVRKQIKIDPLNGIKSVFYKIDGFAFTEFNNVIYFNPNLINQKSLSNQALFINDISTTWAQLVSNDGKPAVQEIIAFLIQGLIGTSLNSKALMVGGLTISPNTHFLLPATVGKLLGAVNDDVPDSTNYKNVISAKDIYLYLFGIQQYSSSLSNSLASGMNPSNLKTQQQYPNFYYTKDFCGGNSLLKPEFWNQTKLWDILNQYTNSPLNELYSCFRISKFNRVMPTIVFRQTPFTNEDFSTQKFGILDDRANTINVTKFMNLPRWSLGAESVFSVDIGRDESARVNFVQYYAKSNFSSKGVEASGETAAGNYVFDKNDIVRSGLRPYIVQNQFDDLPDTLVANSVIWARIIGDAVIGQHLKLNGTLECIGIVDPISVGDNLQFNNTVYHIEQITHTCIDSVANGIKTFRTILKLSNGLSINSSTKGTDYSEMTYSTGYSDRANDYEEEQILPGISESQDIYYRNAPDNPDTPHSTGKPFPQPSTTGKPRTGE